MPAKFIDVLRDSAVTSLSFEFFPPKTPEGMGNLELAFNQLLELSPTFASVTYGAGGSNQETSLAVVENFAPRLDTVAHLTCIGSSRLNVLNLLARYESVGVAGLLALRGDLPAGSTEAPISDFKYAIELLELAAVESDLSVGVSAFPEKHPESADLAWDIAILKRKQDAGAEYAITQLFFDIEAYRTLVLDARNAGVTIPIIPGVMPISNAKQVLRMAEMSGAKMPLRLYDQLSGANSDESARAIGMDFSANFIQELIDMNAPGVHIFTLNHSQAATELAKAVGLA